MLSGTPKIVVNLRAVKQIDSGGIGILVGYQSPANLAGASNMSCPNHSPTPSATSPKEFHCEGQTECP